MEMSPDRRLQRIDRGIKVRSDSLYVLCSVRDLAWLAAPRVLLAGALLLAPIVLAPWPYWERVALAACIMALLALSFDFLANQTHHPSRPFVSRDGKDIRDERPSLSWRKRTGI